ncbi:hypothetical protein BASA62_006929 [Batrachochytrium salamandrivorans]|nr:hypothetical protein BASA62_006929 [Batrachochytrium salamandrivorans]
MKDLQGLVWTTPTAQNSVDSTTTTAATRNPLFQSKLATGTMAPSGPNAARSNVSTGTIASPFVTSGIMSPVVAAQQSATTITSMPSTQLRTASQGMAATSSQSSMFSNPHPQHQRSASNADDIFGNLVGAFGSSSLRGAATPALSLDEQCRQQLQQKQQQIQKPYSQSTIASAGQSSSSSSFRPAFTSPQPSPSPLYREIATTQPILMSNSPSAPLYSGTPIKDQPISSALSQPYAPSSNPLHPFDGLSNMGTLLPLTAGSTLVASGATRSLQPMHATKAAGFEMGSGVDNSNKLRLSPIAPSISDPSSGSTLYKSESLQRPGIKLASRAPQSPNNSSGKDALAFSDLLTASQSHFTSIRQDLSASKTPLRSTSPNPTSTSLHLLKMVDTQPPKQAEAWGNLDFLDLPGKSNHATHGAHDTNVDIFDVSYLGSQVKQQPKEIQKEADENPLGTLAGPVQTTHPASPNHKKPAPSSQSPTLPTGGFQTQQLRETHAKQLVHDRSIAEIVSIGFSVSSAVAALDASGQDVALAIDMLVQNQKAEKQFSQSSPTHSSRSTPFSDTPPSRDRSDYPTENRSFKGNDFIPDELDDNNGIPGTQQIIANASAFGMSIFKNAKTLVGYSTKAITQAIEKASDRSALSAGGSGGVGSRDGAHLDAIPYSQNEYSQWGGKPFRDHDSGDDSDSRNVHGFARYSDDRDSDHSHNEKGGRGGRPLVDSDEEFEVPLHRLDKTGQVVSGDSLPPSKTPPTRTHEDIMVFPELKKTCDDPGYDLIGSNTSPSTHMLDTLPKSSIQRTSPRNVSNSVLSNRDSIQSAPFHASEPPSAIPKVTPPYFLPAETSKLSGNDLFKRGQFSDAATHYSTALQLLRDAITKQKCTIGDPVFISMSVTLLNNRAAARLKTGEYQGVVSDCSEAIGMVPGDLRSLTRRACAYEALESWELALTDYRAVMSSGGKGVSESIIRCNRALRVVNPVGLNETSHSRHTTVPVHLVHSSTKSTNAYVQAAVDTAVQKLRDQTTMNEQEDALKLALKDQVDEKIQAWRRNKEDNLRALISSLDMVLWPELGWKTIGLAELVTPQQLKIRYMKAVAKVHPDKLSNDVSTEHRLIANSVFAALNKAWDSFKASNNL